MAAPYDAIDDRPSRTLPTPKLLGPIPTALTLAYDELKRLENEVDRSKRIADLLAGAEPESPQPPGRLESNSSLGDRIEVLATRLRIALETVNYHHGRALAALEG